MKRQVAKGTLIVGLASMVSLGAVRVALADTVQFEGKHMRRDIGR